MEKKESKLRLHLIDEYRGFVVLNMIAYHAIWDIVYMFGANWQWYKSEIGFVWQQWICWSFILVSGFCWQMGRNPFKRGMMVYAGGAIISLVTLVAMPQSKVMFGILTFLGSAMILMIPLDALFRKLIFGFASSYERNIVSEKKITLWDASDLLEGKDTNRCLNEVNLYGKIKACCGVVISFVLFLFTYRVNRGYLGFDGNPMIVLPSKWYANGFTTYLGFPEPGFFSTDYFSIFPWIFLFMTGYFLSAIILRNGHDNKDVLKHSSDTNDNKIVSLKKMDNLIFDKRWKRSERFHKMLEKSICPPLGWIGRNALVIYMLHQPVIYGVLYVLNI